MWRLYTTSEMICEPRLNQHTNCRILMQMLPIRLAIVMSTAPMNDARLGIFMDGRTAYRSNILQSQRFDNHRAPRK